MWKVDINLLKQLRNSTQAPLKDCKNALIKSNWDLDSAVKFLREAGALKAAKKAGRATDEWVVKAKKEWDVVAAIKLACETDFAAKNEKFVETADKLLDEVFNLGQEVNSLEELDSEFIENNLMPLVNDIVAVIWENIRLTDVVLRKGSSYLYEHPGSKVVGVVLYNGTANDEIAKEIALQSVAMNPEYIKVEDVPADIVSSHKELIAKDLEGSNKPADILEKIVEWRMRKIYEELVLLEQTWIRDDSKKVKDLITSDFELVDIIRFAI